MKTIVRTSLDYGPREEQSEDRLNCRTVLKTVCEDLTAKDCLEVCEQSCEGILIPDCKFTTVGGSRGTENQS